jgi:hypothetical protein
MWQLPVSHVLYLVKNWIRLLRNFLNALELWSIIVTSQQLMMHLLRRS